MAKRIFARKLADPLADFAERFSAGINDFKIYKNIIVFIGLNRFFVFDLRLNFNHRAAVRRPAGNKNPVRRDGHRRGLVQPDMAVNARALVEPALELARVHLHRYGVAAANARHIRDVRPERVITALVPDHFPAVDPDCGVSKRTVELQPETLARVGRRQVKRAPIPANAVAREARPDRLESVALIGGGIERQFNRPVVRQVERAPV